MFRGGNCPTFFVLRAARSFSNTCLWFPLDDTCMQTMKDRSDDYIVERWTRYTLHTGSRPTASNTSLAPFFLADNLKPYTTAEKCVHYILTKCIVWHLCHMAVKRGHWMSRVLREWMLHGTIVLGIFSMDFRGKVLSHYSFSVKRYLWRTLLIRENCCSGVN